MKIMNSKRKKLLILTLLAIAIISAVKDYSDQEVAILEFHSLADETPFLAGKLLIFIRDGYIYALFGAANREEIVPQLRLTIDEISASLNFYAAK